MRAMPVTAVLLLLMSFAASAMTAPEIEWVRTFGTIGTVLYDVWETSEENYIIGALDSIILTDSNGNILWTVSSSSIGWCYSKFEDVLPLSDGGFLATGVGKVSEASSYSIPLLRLSANGNVLWCKSYGYDEFTEYAFDSTELNDGGYAIAARKGAQAWILRTDAQGDTLWTREWGEEYWDSAVSILYIDNGLTVLARGRTESFNGPYLLRYDMDGNLLWENTIDFAFPGGSPPIAQEMCRASDGGLLIMDNYHPEIAHTDLYGNFDWYFNPPGVGEPWGWSVNTTMDGGIIFGGECADDPEKGGRGICGMVSRHDSLGNELWRDYVYNSGCDIIYSIRQLSQGGYIAAGYAWSAGTGGQGFLMKYAPELGIENEYESSSPAVCIDTISPNPIHSSAVIEFSLAEPGNAVLSLYDVNGRVVDTITEGIYSAGSNTVEWNPSEELSSGYYLMRIETLDGWSVKSCLLLR